MKSLEKEPIWAEIKNDHFEEPDTTGGFYVAYIDAYKTEDGDEEGQVIAKVIGALIDRKPTVYVSYNTAEARIDALAQAYIRKATEEVKLELMEYRAENDRKAAISSDSAH